MNGHPDYQRTFPADGPCPSCGGRGTMVEFSYFIKKWFVQCDCGIRTRLCDTEDEAAKIWRRDDGA